MPSKSKKQHKFMAAVANNPEFAANAGVPQSVGASFMAKDKKVKKYQAGDLVEMVEEGTPTKLERGVGSVLGSAPAGMMGEGSTRGPNPDELPSRVMQEEQEDYLLKLQGAGEAEKKKKKKKKKTQKKMGGGMLKYAYGGKVKGVRGAGCARQGVRKAKMVKMKGA